MGGRLQIRWGGKAKKRRLLLRTIVVLRFIQLAFLAGWIFSTMQAELLSVCFCRLGSCFAP